MAPLAEHGEGQLIGSGDGSVHGQRVRGTPRWTLLELPGELVCEMNPTLAIHTEDGARISIEGRGYRHRASRTDQLWLAAPLLFSADEEGYAWLDGALGVWEGEFDAAQGRPATVHSLIAHSPLLSWLYHIFSVRALAAVLGTAEIIASLLIALRPAWPRASTAGSAFAVLLFAGTLSFLFTTPGVTAAPAGGFPVLSVLPGQFLLEDIVLIGAALWTLGDSLGAAWAKARPAR